MKFTKMEGIGNDYIYVDGISQNICLDKDYITKISDRHFGIGSDGMIVILKSDIADFKMRIFNADGSEAKMCGNGIRCFSKFCYDKGLTQKKDLKIETLSGIKTVHLNESDKKITSATVSMGMFEILDTNKTYLDYNYDLISMGNPHGVTLVDSLDLDVNTIGESISCHSLFEGGINVEFVKVLSRSEIQIRVYERGSKETMACGTGACASVAYCFSHGLCDHEVTVHLLGGDLNITILENDVLMNGPCTTVFEGEI